MKKLIIIFMFVSGLLFGSAPKSFMGVNYSQPFSKFKSILDRRFKMLQKSHELIAYQGKFAGHNKAIIVINNYDGKLASAIVMVPIAEHNYVDIYNSLSKSLINKYGKPTEIVSYYDYPYSSGDNFEWQAITLRKAHFSKKWRSEAAFLSVDITSRKTVNIYYINNPVYNAKTAEANKKNNSDF